MHRRAAESRPGGFTVTAEVAPARFWCGALVIGGRDGGSGVPWPWPGVTRGMQALFGGATALFLLALHLPWGGLEGLFAGNLRTRRWIYGTSNWV